VDLISTGELQVEQHNGADGQAAGPDCARAVQWTLSGFEASPAVVCVAGWAGEVEELGGEGFSWM